VIEHFKIAPESEQRAIKDFVVHLDYVGSDVMEFFEHLAQAIAI